AEPGAPRRQFGGPGVAADVRARRLDLVRSPARGRPAVAGAGAGDGLGLAAPHPPRPPQSRPRGGSPLPGHAPAPLPWVLVEEPVHGDRAPGCDGLAGEPGDPGCPGIPPWPRRGGAGGPRRRPRRLPRGGGGGLASEPLQGGPREYWPGHGQGPVALQPPPELFRRLAVLVGSGGGRPGCGPVVGPDVARAADDAAGERLWGVVA